MMEILIFGQLVDIIGSSKIIIDKQDSISNLRKYLLATYPALKDKTFLIAFNHEVVEDSFGIDAEGQIALLPPYSGG